MWQDGDFLGISSMLGGPLHVLLTQIGEPIEPQYPIKYGASSISRSGIIGGRTLMSGESGIISKIYIKRTIECDRITMIGSSSTPYDPSTHRV